MEDGLRLVLTIILSQFLLTAALRKHSGRVATIAVDYLSKDTDDFTPDYLWNLDIAHHDNQKNFQIHRNHRYAILHDVTLTSGPAYPSGDYSGAVKFQGTSTSFMEVENTDGTLDATRVFTWVMVVHPASLGGTGVIMEYNDGLGWVRMSQEGLDVEVEAVDMDGGVHKLEVKDVFKNIDWAFLCLTYFNEDGKGPKLKLFHGDYTEEVPAHEKIVKVHKLTVLRGTGNIRFGASFSPSLPAFSGSLTCLRFHKKFVVRFHGDHLYPLQCDPNGIFPQQEYLSEYTMDYTESTTAATTTIVTTQTSEELTTAEQTTTTVKETTEQQITTEEATTRRLATTTKEATTNVMASTITDSTARQTVSASTEEGTTRGTITTEEAATRLTTAQELTQEGIITATEKSTREITVTQKSTTKEIKTSTLKGTTTAQHLILTSPDIAATEKTTVSNKLKTNPTLFMIFSGAPTVASGNYTNIAQITNNEERMSSIIPVSKTDASYTYTQEADSEEGTTSYTKATTDKVTTTAKGESTAQTTQGQTTEAQTTQGQTTEAQTTQGQTTEAQTTQGQTTEAQITQGQTTEAQTTQGQTTEAQTTQGQTSEAQTTQGQTTEAQTTQGQTTEAQTTQGQTTEAQTTQGQTTEAQITQGQTTEAQITQGQTTEAQITQGQTTEAQITQGQTTEAQTTQGQTTEAQTTQGQTTEVQTTQGQTTEAQPTQGQTTEAQTTQGQTTEAQTTQGQTTEDPTIAKGQTTEAAAIFGGLQTTEGPLTSVSSAMERTSASSAASYTHSLMEASDYCIRLTRQPGYLNISAPILDQTTAASLGACARLCVDASPCGSIAVEGSVHGLSVPRKCVLLVGKFLGTQPVGSSLLVYHLEI